MSALIAQSTQLAQPTAQDDGDALALRYGAEVSLRGARGLGLSVAPVREADDVVFEAAVGGLNLGAADERFVVCNAMVRDDKGPVRYGDVVGLRSRLARGRCLGVRDAAFAGEDEAPAFRRALVGAGERWEVLSAADAGSAAARGAAAPRRGDVVRSGDSVNLRAPRAGDAYLRRRAGAAGADDAAELGRGGADGPGADGAWRLAAAGAPHWSRWLDDRPYLSGAFGAWASRAVEVGGAGAADDFERDLAEDVLSALGGREGGRVRRAVGDGRLAVDDGNVKPEQLPLLELARRCVPLGDAFLKCRAFCRGAARYERGRCAHAAAAKLREVLREYLVFVAQLETVVRSGKGGLARLAATCRDASVALDALVAACAAVDAAPAGGAVVDALADAARDARDADAKRVLTSLAEAAAAPYLQALRRWCVDGQLDDPYGEFCVAEDVDAEKTAVARDYNASYWDERFTSDAGKAAGGAVKSHLAKVLTAGKYRVVLRDAACSGEDNELEATWAALTPADVVEDAAGRLARAIDRAYAASAAELKAVLFERERGLEKLRVLKRFFLAGQGDFLANFLDLADAELRKPAQKASPTRLAHLLAVALAASARGEGAVIEGLRLEPALASRDLRAHLDAIHRHEGADDDDAVVTETPLLAVDAFVLDCRAPWPAALLLSRRSVVKYQLAFRRVFRAKRVERRLLSCWTDQQASKRWCGRGATRSALAPAFLLRQRMLHFAQSLVFYATSDVVGARWAGLEEELRRAPHVDAALAAHDAFLDAVLRDLLLANHRLLGLVADLERSCDRFCDAADRFSEAALDAATAAARRAGVAPGARAALAETTLTAALPAYVDGVRAAGASWRRLAGQFVDALRAECRVQRGSHLADLLARLQDHD